MVTYNYDQILGQRVSFNSATDILRFETLQAAAISFATSGVTLMATGANGSITLDATPLLTETTLALFSTSNSSFASNSVLAVGDLTSGTTADANANAINFTTNALLTSALASNNLVHGLAGGDTITMSNTSGNNVIYGGSDADTIIAGSGNNTIYGGNGFADTTDGADRITVGGGNNVIYSNAGADSVSFSAVTAQGNTLRFWGGSGGDSLTASNAAGQFEIYGGTDNDVISLPGAASGVTLYGGDGNDTLSVASSVGNVTIYGGDAFADTSDGGDAITLGNGSSLVYANAGADTITGAVAATHRATLYLGSGADSMTSATATGTYLIYGGTDGDSINLTNHFADATIYGGSGANDTADGGDTIVGSSSGNNLIYGNAGADKITVRPGANQSAIVYAGGGNDTITATPSNTSAVLQLFGNGGNNEFVMDFSVASPIVRLMDYGNGTNSIDITLSGGASAADLTLSRDNTQTLIRNGTGEQIVLTGFQGNFTTTSFDISDDSALITNFGNAAATLAGTEHDDQLIAGQNGDTLTAGAGVDLLIGGGGNDRFAFASANVGATDTVRGGAGTDTLQVGTSGTAITDAVFENKSSIETFKLESGDFSTAGVTLGSTASAAGIRTIDASTSSKATVTLSSMTSGITYTGATAEDVLIATNHADAIDGKAGADRLQGNDGDDTLTGGDGDDVFAYAMGQIDGSDHITDFDFGTSTTFEDKLQFSAASNAYNLGNLNAVVDGAIITSITSAGATATEIIILKSVAIASTNITSSLNTINADIDSGRSVLNLFFDSTESRAVMYLDINGSASGGHSKLITFDNLTTLAALDAVDFTDFTFV